MRLEGIIVFVFLVCVFIASCNRRDGGGARSLAEDLVACSRDDNAACLHACQQGAGDACYLAGLKEHQARDGDASRTRFLFRRACKLKDWMSCLLVSQMMEAGIGGPKSSQEAEDVLQQACNGGLQLACAGRATEKRGGERFPPPPPPKKLKPAEVPRPLPVVESTPPVIPLPVPKKAK